MRAMPIFVLVVVLSQMCGCAGFAEYRQSQLRNRRQPTSHVDAIWKQGYGFNNPNNDRIRQGLPPVNFDGSTGEKRNGYFSELFGDMLGYSIKSGFVAVRDRLLKK